MIDKEFVLNIHDTLEMLQSCLPGIRDLGLLESAIDGQQWFNTLEEKTIHVAYSICANHIFNDGNKRTAYLIIRSLENEGINVNDQKVESEILALAKTTISKSEFTNRIMKCLY